MADAILEIENQLSQDSIYYNVITSGSVTATPQSGTIVMNQTPTPMVKFTGLAQTGQTIPLRLKNSASSTGALQIQVKMKPPAVSTVLLSAKP